MLASSAVVEAMVAEFQQAEGEMAMRLLAALQAGLALGGEAGPVHSAAVKVVDDYSWPLVDLRVDWHEQDPIGELTALWLAYEPQMQAYITRALDPREAPSYGVPGDE
nr:major pilin protein fimA [Raoultella sp. NCTC 9187]